MFIVADLSLFKSLTNIDKRHRVEPWLLLYGGQVHTWPVKRINETSFATIAKTYLYNEGGTRRPLFVLLGFDSVSIKVKYM